MLLIFSEKSLLVCKVSSIAIKRFKWSTKNVTVFCDLFGLTRKEFFNYRRVNELSVVDIQRLGELSTLRKSFGIEKEDFLQYPVLFKKSPSCLEQQYFNLKEGGFQQINAKILAHYGKIVHKNILFLKDNNYMPICHNVAEAFLNYMVPKPQIFIGDLTDENTFSFIHHTLLTRYLVWKFNTSYDTVQKFYRNYSMSKVKSFQHISRNFQFVEQIGYSLENIFKFGSILNTPPKTIEKLLIKVPTLAGLNICEAITLFPKLVRIPPEQVLKINNYLKEANISDSSIQKHMNIFFMSPELVHKRIEEVKKIPEFNLFRNHSNFLQLIIYHNEARSRLSFLKKLKIKCASVGTFCSQKKQFELYVQDRHDIHRANAVTLYIKDLLHCDDDAISANLKRHSYYRHVSFLTIFDSYTFLRDLHFTNDAITNVISVLLYPRNKLKAAYENVCQTVKNINQTEKLNLVLYLIEKDHHFTGNGIWNNTENA
ncbi:hypothetical protein FQA39_LY06775 [Lamprigera yunnana]|nr:hypothetical protein FQA39_LY06775 [Lamprigera yunnana]